jgi:LuxR family quorum sensing-dependent transcriptional regulator
MSERQSYFDQDTRTKLVDYSMEVESLVTPDEVLNRLHDIIAVKNSVRVLGASRFPVKVGDWRHVELGKNVFVHRDAPREWVTEWTVLVAHGHPAGLMTARMCLAPFTMTELSRMLDPVGIDRWAFELALKHGMRDGYLCPVGGRWLVAYWSPKVLGQAFTQQARGLLYMAASAAAIRMERLIGDDAKRVGPQTCLTPREQSVLRFTANGHTCEEAAKALGLGEETVRSHLKKAQAKLGTRNRTHTVAEAMRHLLIV